MKFELSESRVNECKDFMLAGEREQKRWREFT